MMTFQDSSPLAPTRSRQRNNKIHKNQKWTEYDDETLSTIAKNGDVNWNRLTSIFPDKTPQQIMERWKKVLDPSITKGSWTGEEDAKIINYVQRYGTKSWTKLASLLPGRVGKQCRERWMHHLDPKINHGPWLPQEDMKIIELHAAYGNKWSLIAANIPNRTDNSIKNRWHSTLRKKIEKGNQALTDDSFFNDSFGSFIFNSSSSPNILSNNLLSPNSMKEAKVDSSHLMNPLSYSFDNLLSSAVNNNNDFSSFNDNHHQNNSNQININNNNNQNINQNSSHNNNNKTRTNNNIINKMENSKKTNLNNNMNINISNVNSSISNVNNNNNQSNNFNINNTIFNMPSAMQVGLSGESASAMPSLDLMSESDAQLNSDPKIDFGCVGDIGNDDVFQNL
ncbi:Myb-like DNA-binding domain containing protein [Tritrichomonas foetus]|uniref:Myb-like DNA-binding domain containing protein n=1 Tax=Tritrichomonas foetus TaxID=1144522 RepID=A0A1J4KPB0_9EUKA|nr:Myb-like DNA-binding domain containing protein [Tritrichomonas foetus]|eukprot:OHT11542.1 Myb-like DNA-binding domain containing protein [Tritrichomonas foetus]